MKFSALPITAKNLRRVFLLSVFLPTSATLHAGNTWTGGGVSTNWSDNNNWGGAQPAYGTLTFTAGGTQGTTSIVNQNYNMNRLLWTGGSSWILNNSGGFGISLFDNGGAQAKIENESTGLVKINAPITFAANNGSPPNPFGEINAVNGDITFGSGTLTVSGSSVNGIKLFGSGRVVTFNNTVSAAGKWFGITTGGTGNTINIGGAFTSSDFYVMNDGALNLNSGGSLTTSVRLGGDFGNTGNQNQAKSGAFNLTATAGGQTFSGVINSVTGNTSGTLAVNSQNTSGINALSGHLALDSNLTISQASGGTMAITQGRSTASGTTTATDIKNRPLTFSGGGNFAVGATIPTGFGTIYDSVSGGGGTGIIMAGTGSLSLNDANSYRGTTVIKSGTLFVGANNALGSSNGTVGTTGNTVFVGDTTGSATARLLSTGAFTVGNAITVHTGSSGTASIGGDSASTSVYSGNLTLGTSGINPSKDVTLVAAPGGVVEFQGTINENTNNTTVANITIGDATHLGTVKLSSTNNGYSGITTITNGATLEVMDLSTSNSSIGNSSSAAANLVLDGGTLKYTGAGENTARLFTFTANGGAIDASAASNAALSFTANGVVALGNGDRMLTLTGTSTGANTLTSVIANPASGATSLAKSDAGTWIVSGANTYTGATTVSGGTLEAAATGALTTTSSITLNTGGTLLLSGTGNMISDTAPLTLAGGTFNTGGLSETAGALTLTANSVIDFGAGSSLLTFANSSASNWGNFRLSIWNWSGNPVTGGGVDQLRFTGNGLTTAQLSQVDFFSDSGISKISITPSFFANEFVGGAGEVVPVPEMSSALAAIGLLGMAGLSKRRRR